MSNEQKWTKEPWKNDLSKLNNKGNMVCISLEDYMRSVDCVNALAGIDDVEKVFKYLPHQLQEIKDLSSDQFVKNLVDNVVRILFPSPKSEEVECKHQYSEIKDGSFYGHRNCIHCSKPIDTKMTLPKSEESK